MLFYILMSASDDEETQIKGIVFLFFNMRPNPVEVDWEVGWKLPPLLTKLPVRVVAGHLCYDDCIVPPLISAIRNVSSLPFEQPYLLLQRFSTTKNFVYLFHPLPGMWQIFETALPSSPRKSGRSSIHFNDFWHSGR
jgi:hypothetical protein